MKEEKTPNNIVDFQPDALEIKNEKLSPAIRFCVYLPVVLVTIAIVWGILAKMDVVVQGNGKLVTNESTIVMKPLERSVIKKIHVKIGDIVKKDQILITFDPSFNKAEADRLHNEISALKAQLERLHAEFNEKPYAGGNGQFERWQSAIYKQRQEYYRERMNYFNETLQQIRASMKSRSDNLKKQKERLAAIQKLEDMFRRLHSKQAASLKELIQMSISRMEMEAAVDELENALLELQHKMGTTKAEQNSFVQEWRNKISEDMVSVDRNLTSVKKEYDKVARLIEYVYLRAPCESVVHEIASFSPGSAVQEAEALITLIPLNGEIELECKIRPQDIGKIKVGSKSRIKLSAYPFQKYGTLDGTVRTISENTFQEQSNALEAGAYYRTRVTVSGKLNTNAKDFRLIPGMEAQCEIKCDRRRVIEYVLYPLIKALDEAGREP